jgi:hypothetical protein
MTKAPSVLPEAGQWQRLPDYNVELGKKTYSVLCEGKELFSGDIKELGFKKGDSKKMRAQKVATLIAGYLLKRN